MSSTFHLVIASVGKTQFDGKVQSATLPGSAGDLTVLAHHEPFVTTLKKGTISLKDASGDKKEYSVEDGVLEVSGNRAVVLL